MYRGLLGLPATQNQEASLAPVFAPAPIVGNWAVINTGPFGFECWFGAPMSSGVIYFYAFPLTRRITLSDLGARLVTSSAGGNFALAIYASERGRPAGMPLAATGNMSTTSATLVTSSITGGNVTLAPGIYWSAIWQDNATAGYAIISQRGPSIASIAFGPATAANVNGSADVGNLTLAVIETFNSSAWPNPQNRTIFENNNDERAAAIIGKFA